MYWNQISKVTIWIFVGCITIFSCILLSLFVNRLQKEDQNNNREYHCKITNTIIKTVEKNRFDYPKINTTIVENDVIEDNWFSLGTFKITHYGIDCYGCGTTTSTGTIPQVNRTIAVDPKIIPLGSEVMINGKIYIAEDTGGAIQGNIIDLFVESEQKGNELGIYYTEVYIKNE